VEELRGRLRKKGFQAQEIAHCLVWLEERDLLDDSAFAQALTRDRLRFSPRSPSLLRRELALKGIDSSLAGRAVEAVLEEEGVSEGTLAARAAEAWIRRQGAETLRDLLNDGFTPERERARRRFNGFLARRGFRGEAARAGVESGLIEARKLLSKND
jgi:SOS response regulatory protein OraA/RecX